MTTDTATPWLHLDALASPVERAETAQLAADIRSHTAELIRLVTRARSIRFRVEAAADAAIDDLPTLGVDENVPQCLFEIVTAVTGYGAVHDAVLELANVAHLLDEPAEDGER